jgi:hypothetical protein
VRHPSPIAAIAALALAFASAASAQTLYKWVDKDGRVQFADKPPTGFKGEVTKIQVDAQPEPAAPRSPPPAASPRKAAPPEEDKAAEMAAKRRQVREELAARLSAARAKLEAARKALDEGQATTADERQFVRQEFARDARRPERTPPPRTNCMSQVTTDGRAVWNCPRPIPNDAYFERQHELEEAVKQAEDELADAERAYRRGVD